MFGNTLGNWCLGNCNTLWLCFHHHNHFSPGTFYLYNKQELGVLLQIFLNKKNSLRVRPFFKNWAEILLNPECDYCVIPSYETKLVSKFFTNCIYRGSPEETSHHQLQAQHTQTYGTQRRLQRAAQKGHRREPGSRMFTASDLLKFNNESAQMMVS